MHVFSIQFPEIYAELVRTKKENKQLLDTILEKNEMIKKLRSRIYRKKN